MTFPAIDGEDLDGTKLAFPRDFGARTIAILAFDLKQRDALESWVPFVDGYVRAGHIRGRVFPILSKSMRMMKGLIVTTMRKAVPFPEVRAATVPLFVDLDAFCAGLDIADRSTVHVIVVDPDGSILTHQIGAHSTTAAAAIDAYVGTAA